MEAKAQYRELLAKQRDDLREAGYEHLKKAAKTRDLMVTRQYMEYAEECFKYSDNLSDTLALMAIEGEGN